MRQRRGRLEVPFVCHGAEHWHAGALRLDDEHDPLGLISDAGGPQFAGYAWATALIGFAELTCVERRAVDVISHRAAARHGGPIEFRVGGVARPLSSRQFVPRGLVHGPALTPTSDTLDIAGGYVVGHRRLLQAEQVASERAIQAAELAGIVLGPGETWVRPHARGLPADSVLVFTWAL